MITNKEKELLELIRKDPQMSQNDMAERLGITRSSVSVHINNLYKKGYIAGKGYVLNEMDYVTIIGAANVDISGFSEDKIIYADSNPGSIKICSGGVGRNIAENLARLDVNTRLITVLGDDIYGRNIFEECKQVGIEMDHSLILKGETSSTYLAIMDEKGEMALALSDMSILDKMPEEFLKKKVPILKRSRIIVMDAGLPRNIVEFVLANFKDSITMFDPVSVGKAKKFKDMTGQFHTLKLNKLESEFLSDIKIENEKDLERAAMYFIDKGVKKIFITLGSEGVYYRDEKNSGRFKPEKTDIINATGAGDAFVAGVVYCGLNDMDMDYTARFSSAMSKLALRSVHTVSQTISIDNVLRTMNE